MVEGLREVAGKRAEIVYAKGSNLTYDPALEERATMFGRSLGRDGRSDEELLAEALEAARSCDVIVAALGESSEMSGESSSRVDLHIPDAQQALLRKLAETGKPIVLVLFTGRPLILNWEQEHIPAILNVWFGGTEAAGAIGDVLFGDAAPGGRLTTSFPRHVGQLPMTYAYKSTGRPLQSSGFEKFRSNYLDVSNDPLYPFGYGLSYTTFAYGPVTLDRTSMTSDGRIVASVTLTNTGDRDGEEVVQLYIRDVVCSITRPVKELKGFQRVALKRGESRRIDFEITLPMLKFWNAHLDHVAEKGEFEVMIGGNSAETQKKSFEFL